MLGSIERNSCTFAGLVSPEANHEYDFISGVSSSQTNCVVHVSNDDHSLAQCLLFLATVED